MSFLSTLFGDPNARYVAKLRPVIDEINKLETPVASLTNDDLKAKTVSFKERLANGESTLDEILPEAFAIVRETAKRVLGQRHYDVQLMGGVVLHRGAIAEMRTGEGKTLVATAPAYLNALMGKGVHVVTVNDYLARRDAAWMGRVYHALGLTTACLTHESAYMFDPEHVSAPADEGSEHAYKVEQEFLRPISRKEAYAADITYGTNNEFGFDYLRDNMAASVDAVVQREPHYAIIDEVDSILIDEARTPLIISAQAEESADLYYKFARIVATLVENEDYNVDEKMRAATLTEAGINTIEKQLGVQNLYAEAGSQLVRHAEAALKARTLFHRDKEYVVREGEIIIVDEFTGRLMPGRRWSEGLHQAVEAKEGVKIENESQTLATVTLQNFFRMFPKIAGMTGTALTEAEEFHKIYTLEVVSIPTHRANIRKDLTDRVYKNEVAKMNAAVAEIKARHEKGQPVLVGTISIEKNEIISELLNRAGVPHEVLNAKNHEREAAIIAQAGKLGAVTVATNMAGRGVDIILGGNPSDPGEAEKVRALGGLFVMGTERHESRRIDNQLRGRSGRQGDPGVSQFFVSLDDDLMRIFAGDRIKALMERFNLPDDMPIENGLVSRSIESAQRKVEQHNFDIRKHLLEYDDVLNKHRDAVYRKRRQILKLGTEKSVELKEMVLDLIENELERVVMFHTNEETDWNIHEIYEVAHTIFPIEPSERTFAIDQPDTTLKLDVARTRSEILAHLMGLVEKKYHALEAAMVAAGGDMRRIELAVMLRANDALWVEHLDAIEHLRQGIGLRGYGQRDPLIEYKKEAYRMFSELTALIDREVVYNMFKVGVNAAGVTSLLDRKGVVESAPAKEGDGGKTTSSSSATTDPKFANVGRNDQCPCGSGKKFKKCHGA